MGLQQQQKATMMTRFIVWPNAALIAVTLLILPRVVSGETIFDNGSPDLSIAALSDFKDGRQVADDFQLLPGGSTITDVHWWGAYFFGNTPTAPDNFTIRVFVDSSGVPAVNPLAERAVGNVGRNDTGADIGSDVYEYSATIDPIVLDANATYWLSIVNNTSADVDDLWYWPVKSSIGNGATRDADGIGWTGSVPFPNPEMAFRLTGTIVPEPSTLVLAVSGVIGLIGLAGRQRMVREPERLNRIEWSRFGATASSAPKPRRPCVVAG